MKSYVTLKFKVQGKKIHKLEDLALWKYLKANSFK